MCRLWEYLDGVIRYFCLSQIDTVSYRGILSQDFQICQTLIKGLSTVSSFWSTPNFTCKVADVELHLKKKVFVCFVSISGLLSQTEAINVLDFFFFFFVIPASVQSLHFITFSSHFTENDGSAYRGCILFSFLLLSFVIEGNTRNVITWGNWEVIMISLEVNLQKKEAVGGGWGGASHFFNLIQMWF